MALGLELSKGFAVSRAITAFARWDFGTGLALGLLAFVAVAFSLQSELSLMATSKGDLAAHREASGRSVEIARSQVAAAKDELTTMGHAITPATNVTVGEADAILRGLNSDPAWLKTANCTNVTLASSKAYCGKVAEAEGIRARATHRADLEATIRDGEAVLSSGAVVEVADPGSEAIADFLGALGFGKIEKVAVAHWTVLVGVLALEVGSAFAVVLGSAMVPKSAETRTTTPLHEPAVHQPKIEPVHHVGTRDSGWCTSVQVADAVEPPTKATVRAETVIQQPSKTLNHEGL